MTIQPAELRELAHHLPGDVHQRRQLYEAARLLYMALETPFDAMHRLFWSVSASPPSNRPQIIDVAQLPMVQVGVDLGLFRKMAEDLEKKWTVDELAAVLKADRTLLYRVLRYFFSFSLLRENSDFTYSPNETSQWLATPGAEGGVKHYMETIAPTLQALPEVLRQQGHQNPSNPTDTAFQRAHNTQSHAYSWTPSDPSAIDAFLVFMKSQRASQKLWTEKFPMQLLRLSDQDLVLGRAFFVDVGGAWGHQCVSLRNKYPQLPGRVVLQDKENVIAKVNRAELEGLQIEVMAYDFFTAQPVKHAKAYYLRNIMHDWPDEKCVEILDVLRAALAPDSMILIDDMVLPDKGANWKQAQKDIQMMAAVASMERSETQWKMLMERAGLRIWKTCTYDSDLGDSVIIAVAA